MGSKREKTVFDSPEFLAERKKWYEKLEAKGFKDIEYTNWEDGSSGNLLSGYGHMDAVRFYSQDVADYFYRAAHYLKDVKRHWGSKSLEYRAWKIHSRGGSLKEIKDELGVSMPVVKRIVGKVRMNMRADGKLVDPDGGLTLLDYTLLELPDDEG